MKFVIVFVVFISSFFMQTLHAEDELRDFGFRVGVDVLNGVGEDLVKGASVYTDMNLVNQSTRMLFGFAMYEMGQTEAPTISIQSIGVEQNFRLPLGQVFLGVLHNKTYQKKNDNKKFRSRLGLSFHVGYKYPLDAYQELVFLIGQQYQPLAIKQTSSMVLKDKVWASKLAMEWYF